jgi:hypothetical protein
MNAFLPRSQPGRPPQSGLRPPRSAATVSPAQHGYHAAGTQTLTPGLQAAPDGARLSLGPAKARRAGINGGWWPRSRDAGAELPGLIAGLSTRAGRVNRVALQVGAFGNIPRQLTVGGRKVRVAWFRYMNMHTVSLTMADRDDLTLLVIPPQASPVTAAEALRLAASGRHTGPPEAILAAAGVDRLALARFDDDGAPLGPDHPAAAGSCAPSDIAALR